MERRYLFGDVSGVSLEPRAEGERPKIRGIASVYYDGTAATEYKLWTDTVERIMPGAFDAALERDDVRALFNHDSNMVLGRTPKTLTLSDSPEGLRYEIDPADTGVARDVTEHIRRGDVSGSSFAFLVTDEEWRKEDKVTIREIRGVELFDVGPVTYPAYESTTAGVRSVDGVEEARAAFAKWKERNEATSARRSAMQKRARIVELGL